jgi:hypothetical protein
MFDNAPPQREISLGEKIATRTLARQAAAIVQLEMALEAAQEITQSLQQQLTAATRRVVELEAADCRSPITEDEMTCAS